MENQENQVNELTQAVINMAVEAWRFAKVYTRAISKLDAGENSRYISQYRWFMKKNEETLAKFGITLVNMEGTKFNPGIAVNALNIADFNPDDTLIIEQMMEPIIMGKDGLLHAGTVILRRSD